MHPRRTSKVARATRKAGAIRTKRGSMAEEETAKEKESVAALPSEEETKKTHREGTRHTRPRSPKSKAKEKPHRKAARD